MTEESDPMDLRSRPLTPPKYACLSRRIRSTLYKFFCGLKQQERFAWLLVSQQYVNGNLLRRKKVMQRRTRLLPVPHTTAFKTKIETTQSKNRAASDTSVVLL